MNDNSESWRVLYVYFANGETCNSAVQGETNPHAQGAQRAWRQRARVLAGLILEQSSARRQMDWLLSLNLPLL
jgi:hypothetical protein